MGQSTQQQAAAIGLGAVLGIGLGLLYDILRPLRRRAGKLNWIFDAVYALASGLTLFLLTMFMPDGRLGLWEPVSAMLGFAAYMYLLSPLIFPVFDSFLDVIGLPFKKIRKYLRKVLNLIFQKGK